MIDEYSMVHGDFIGCRCRLNVKPYGKGVIVKKVMAYNAFYDPREDFIVRLDDGTECQVYNGDVNIF